MEMKRISSPKHSPKVINTFLKRQQNIKDVDSSQLEQSSEDQSSILNTAPAMQESIKDKNTLKRVTINELDGSPDSESNVQYFKI